MQLIIGRIPNFFLCILGNILNEPSFKVDESFIFKLLNILFEMNLSLYRLVSLAFILLTISSSGLVSTMQYVEFVMKRCSFANLRKFSLEIKILPTFLSHCSTLKGFSFLNFIRQFICSLVIFGFNLISVSANCLNRLFLNPIVSCWMKILLVFLDLLESLISLKIFSKLILLFSKLFKITLLSFWWLKTVSTLDFL